MPHQSNQIRKKVLAVDLFKEMAKLQSQGKFLESKPLGDALFANGYDSADFYHLYGLAYKAQDNFSAAEELINKAIAINSENETYHNSLGVLYLHTKKPDQAVIAFNKAIAINPKLFDPWNNMGNALRSLEKYADAEVALKKARALSKDRYEPYLNMALIMMDLRSYKDAEKFMDRAISLAKPLTAQLLIKRLALANRAENFEYVKENYPKLDKFKLSDDERVEADQVWARILEIEGKPDEALALMEKWLGKGTRHEKQLLSVVGMLYSRNNRLKDGIELHKKLLNIEPNHVVGRWNLSLLQLNDGQVEEGLNNYEARWEWREFPSMRRKFDMPQWNGEDITGKRLLVWREQGIGDEIRFSSIIPELKKTSSILTIECSSKLVNLFKRAFEWADVKVEGGLDCRDNPEYQIYDYHIPIGSLARLYRKSVSDFYQNQRPWLPRNVVAENKVRRQLGVGEDKIVVGLCWRSSNRAPSRNRYYLTVEEMLPLRNLSNVVFVTVQYDDCAEEVERIRKLGLPLFYHVNVNQKDDLLSACALLGACDIVLSANVSVADFCGGLGVPVVRMGPPNDAICLGENGVVPWYKTSKYFKMQQSAPHLVVHEVIQRWSEIKYWAQSVTTSTRVVSL